MLQHTAAPDRDTPFATAASGPRYALHVVETPIEVVLCALLGPAWKDKEECGREGSEVGVWKGGGRGADGEGGWGGDESRWWCEDDGETYSVVCVCV